MTCLPTLTGVSKTEDAIEAGEVDASLTESADDTGEVAGESFLDRIDDYVDTDTDQEPNAEEDSVADLDDDFEPDDEVEDVETVGEVEGVDETELVDEPDRVADEVEDEVALVEEPEDATESDSAEVADSVDDDAADTEADDEYELPEIVLATEEDDEPTARTGDDDDASGDVLEELRKADIDGPIVPMAPQDDTTSSQRRPRRSPEYDPAPLPIPADIPRVLGRKPRVRRVTRVVRHVDPWSVFKIALIANLVLYAIVMTAAVLLWNVAYATGTVDNVERFFESFGWSTFEFNGGEIYHSGWVGGIFLVIGFTGLAVLAATLFNLITDLVGGMRFTVLEEEVVETRTSPMRRFVVRRAEPEVPAITHDASGPMIREAVVDDSGSMPR